jgi:hypothetical protein
VWSVDVVVPTGRVREIAGVTGIVVVVEDDVVVEEDVVEEDVVVDAVVVEDATVVDVAASSLAAVQMFSHLPLRHTRLFTLEPSEAVVSPSCHRYVDASASNCSWESALNSSVRSYASIAAPSDASCVERSNPLACKAANIASSDRLTGP